MPLACFASKDAARGSGLEDVDEEAHLHGGARAFVFDAQIETPGRRPSDRLGSWNHLRQLVRQVVSSQ